jgi:hypothetical protein
MKDFTFFDLRVALVGHFYDIEVLHDFLGRIHMVRKENIRIPGCGTNL